MSNRLIFNLAIFLSIVFLPWWIVISLALLSVIFVEKYYEVVIFGVFYDVIFGVVFDGVFMFYGTIFGIILFVVSIFLKKHLIKV